jgi:indole-3-glycerol phosphate synthase
VSLANPSMSILKSIVAQKHSEIAQLDPAPVTTEGLKAALAARGDWRPFGTALRQSRNSSVALIAEVKKASPSAGVLCADFDAVRLARAYEQGGAQCISVLTDERFFQGSLAYLQAVRRAVKLPLLRKDFILDPRQIREAIQWGADAILLIVAILSEAELASLLALARGAGLDVLVEVHDEVELDRALAVGADIIGVNNRDLKTFNVDLGTTERVAAKLRRMAGGPKPLLIAESGIRTRADVARVAHCGAQAILAGETLVREVDIPAKIRELLRKN